MPVELKVPSVGESIYEVVIGEWLKAEGEWVEADEPVVALETDKASLEVPAPSAGTLVKLLKKEGDSANVGDVIAHLDASAKPSAAAAPTPPADKAAAKAADGTSTIRIMPAAQRLMDEKGLRLGDVVPTGPGGRVLKEDVLRVLEQRSAAPAKASPAPAAIAPAAPRGPRHEEVIPMSPLRRRIAGRLVQAQQQAALLTTFNEIDMSAVMALRAEYKQTFIDKYGVKLGFMSFFVKAVIEGLKLFPAINAEIRGEEVVYKDYYDIGVAVGGGAGLVVPVIRSAERLSFAEVELQIRDYAIRAKKKRLKLEELQGGTFTISNGGVYGSLLSTPIINPPQSGILGMHNIVQRPVVVDGQIVARPMMYIALTYDHRLVDGRESVTFLRRIKDCVENPARILLEV